MAKITKPIVKDIGPYVTGKVAILYGTVKAVSPDGTVRMLKINSPVFADDRIVTGDDGSVSIVFNTFPPTQLDLGRLTDVVIDEDIYGPVSPAVSAEAAAEQKAIQEALMAGDQPIELDATAAGAEPDSGGGHPIFVVAPDWAEVTPESGAETRGVTWGTPAQQEYALNQPENVQETVVPTANPDANETQEGMEGSQSAATGNVLDNDTSGDGTIVVTAVNGSENNVGIPIQTDLGGTIIIHPDGSYSYTPPPQADHSQGPVYDVINYTITNSDGNSASSTLTIEVLDTEPLAVADTDTATEGQTLNSVVGVLANDTMSADVPGTVVGLAAGNTGTNSTGTMTVDGTYGKLTINADGSYSYVANGSVAAGSQDVFTYTMQDADGDQSHATLKITFEGDNNVPTAQDSEASQSDAAWYAGTQTADEGTLAFDMGGDTPGTVSMVYDGGLGAATKTSSDGVTTFTASNWTLTINESTGAYKFTQTNAYTHDGGANSDSGKVTVTLTDSDGSTHDAVLNLTIMDDVPLVQITGGDTSVVEGSTISNGIWNYVPGADGATVAVTVDGVEGTFALNEGIDTGKGTLTIKDNGTWTFASLDAQAQPQSIHFTVTATDADSDVSSDDYTIEITDDGTTPAVGPESGTVYESALSDGSGGGVKVASGVFDITLDGDALAKLMVGGVDVTGATMATPITVAGGAGSDYTLEVGRDAGGNYTWTYTLNDDMTHTQPTNDLSLGQSFDIQVTDIDGDVSSTAKLVVTIMDDVPTAFVKSGILYDQDGAHLEAPFASYGADNGTGASVVLSAQTNSEGIIAGVDAAGNPVILTSGGNPVYYELDNNVLKAYTVPDSGTGEHHTVFTVTPDMTSGTYSVDVFHKIDVTQEISYDLTGGKFHGGNQDNSYFYLDLNNDSHPDNTILWMRGIDPDGKNTVNWNNNGIGVGTAAALDQSETLKITLMDPSWNMPASPTDTNQDINKFDLTNKVTISFTDLAANEEYSYTLWKHVDTNSDGVADNLVQVGSEVHVTTHAANESLTVFSADAFDQINITAGSTSSFLVTGASMWTTTEATDVTVHLQGLVTDADGDSITVPFDLTFDGTPSVLVGTAANEVLQGGDGNDTLTGGAGADIFKVGQGNDHITDYKLTDGDKVDITSVLNSAEEDHSRLGFHTDGGKAVLEIYDDNAHTNLLGSVTFDNITDAVDLNSLLGKIDLDHSS